MTSAAANSLLGKRGSFAPHRMERLERAWTPKLEHPELLHSGEREYFKRRGPRRGPQARDEGKRTRVLDRCEFAAGAGGLLPAAGLDDGLAGLAERAILGLECLYIQFGEGSERRAEFSFPA